MTSGQAATIGLSLQIVGGFIAVYGLLSTWTAYSAGPLFPGLRRRLSTLVAQVRGRLGLHRHVERTTSDALTSTGNVDALIEWATLPADQDLALAELDRRSRELNKAVARVEHEGRDAINAVRRDLGLGLADEAKRRVEDVRRLATRGIKIALFGLCLILAGTVFQWFAALWQALAGN